MRMEIFSNLSLSIFEQMERSWIKVQLALYLNPWICPWIKRADMIVPERTDKCSLVRMKAIYLCEDMAGTWYLGYKHGHLSQAHNLLREVFGRWERCLGDGSVLQVTLVTLMDLSPCQYLLFSKCGLDLRKFSTSRFEYLKREKVGQ